MIETKEAQKDREAIARGEGQLKNKSIVAGRPDQSRASESTPDFTPLFGKNEAEQFHTQWLEIQSRFVDDPNVSVKQADELVARMIKNIMNSFADKRISLEKQWKSGDKVSTEDLRLALKHYRSFFDRLLSLNS